MIEYRRDYIGSADAHHLITEKYDSLIKQKIKDTADSEPGYLSEAMRQGLALEVPAALQMTEEYGFPWFENQKQFVHPEIGYCKCSVDYFYCDIELGCVIEEQKTSQTRYKSLEAIYKKYPKYKSQLQYQLWLADCEGYKVFQSGFQIINMHKVFNDSIEREVLVPMYDEDGTTILVDRFDVEPCYEYWEKFEKNAPKFWEKWCNAKDENEKRKEG